MTSPNTGRRNLILLGLGAFLIALTTTAIELWVYRSSGDIYLDRSRPGYLPDDDEITDPSDTSSEFSYPDTGSLDPDELTEYIKELELINAHINELSDPYGPAPLSNESLGITTPEHAAEQETDE